MAINLQDMPVEDIIQMILAQKGQSPEARQPSRFDFEQGPKPPPDMANTGSTIDFANPIPAQAPVPAPRPGPGAGALIPPITPGNTEPEANPYGFGNTANVGPDAMGYAGPWGAGAPTTPEQQRANLARAMAMKPQWSRGGGAGGLF